MRHHLAEAPYFTQAAQLEQALRRYPCFYNTERTHRGYRLHGRTPASAFFADTSRRTR